MNLKNKILLEDDYILIVDKPAGLMVEPDRNQNPNLLETVKQYLKLKSETEIYAQHIHRLDRPVQGIVLFAKKREVLKNLSEQFAQRQVEKFYRALTTQAPENHTGRLEHWHRKEKKKAVLYDYEIEYSEKAILDYQITKLSNNSFLWNIQLHTGKYHQIRAQLSRAGCPVIGDAVYGSTIPYLPNAIALQASRLIFKHPVSEATLDIQTTTLLQHSL